MRGTVVTMARPIALDADPNLARITWLIVVLINPDTPFGPGAASTISTMIQNRTGVTPLSVTISGDGSATVVVPADRGVEDWVAYVASSMAAVPRTGTVQGVGQRARID